MKPGTVPYRTAESLLNEIAGDIKALRDLTDARFEAGRLLSDERLTAINTLIEERDRRYLGLFEANDRRYLVMFNDFKDAMTTALSAEHQETRATFLAMEKAVDKAETAQTAYNERSNEFRGQLDDQAKRLMPREEASVLIAGLNEKIEVLRSEVASLRESRSEHGGRQVQSREGRDWSMVLIGLSVAVAGLLIGFIGLAFQVFRNVSLLGK